MSRAVPSFFAFSENVSKSIPRNGISVERRRIWFTNKRLATWKPRLDGVNHSSKAAQPLLVFSAFL